MANAHNGEHAVAPDQTTVQWSPGAGVEHGHEGTDANLRSTIHWFLATGLFMIVSIAVLWWVYNIWAGYQTSVEKLPSPLFGIRQVPPEPRVLPNPADSQAHRGDPTWGPADLLAEHRRVEEAELNQYGLRNPTTGAPQLPAGAVDAVLAGNRSGRARMGGLVPAPAARVPPPGAASASSASTAPGVEPMPSYSSGGTRPENYLQ
jgi:hypothetical protein